MKRDNGSGDETAQDEMVCVAAGNCTVVRLYYGVPLVFSLVGGFISLGVVYAFKSFSFFD